MIKKNILYSHVPSSYGLKHVKSKIKWSGNIIYKHTGYSNKKLHFILRTGGVTFSLKICMSFFVETHTPFCSTHIKGLRTKIHPKDILMQFISVSFPSYFCIIKQLSVNAMLLHILFNQVHKQFLTFNSEFDFYSWRHTMTHFSQNG